MDEQLKENILNKKIWIRGLYIILFMFVLGITKFIITVIVVFQFIYTVLTGSLNARLKLLGQNLSIFIMQIILYITFNSETKPFPFDEWPSETPPPSNTEIPPENN